MKNKITGSPRRLQLNNAGVSFVELVVALLILAVIIVPLMGLFTSAASANRVNLIRSDADTLSQNIMEAVKAYGFAGTQNQFKKFSDGDSVICLGMEPATVAGGATGEANVYEYEMKNVPEGSHSYDPLELIRDTVASVDSFAGDAEQFDDITCLALMYKGNADEWQTLRPELMSLETIKEHTIAALGDNGHTLNILLNTRQKRFRTE